MVRKPLGTPMSGVYLLHFHAKYKGCQHYIGYSKNIQWRLRLHGTSQGAKLLKAVKAAGITWECARIWPGKDGNFERHLKNWHKARQLCPICNKNIPF